MPRRSWPVKASYRVPATCRAYVPTSAIARHRLIKSSRKISTVSFPWALTPNFQQNGMFDLRNTTSSTNTWARRTLTFQMPFPPSLEAFIRSASSTAQSDRVARSQKQPILMAKSERLPQPAKEERFTSSRGSGGSHNRVSRTVH